jgi:hypothetical protein
MISDILAINDTHYLQADEMGLLKTTKDKLIMRYHIGKNAESLSHITDSIYLVGFADYGLIVWDEEKD